MTKVTLGGRIFRVADYSKRTVVMDHYMRTCIADIGLDRMLPLPGESDAEYMARLHARITGSLKACQLLGGYLLPESVKGEKSVDELAWSPEMAAATTDFLAHLQDEADRQGVDALVMQVGFAFFRHAVELLQSSPSFSQTTATNGPTPSQPTSASEPNRAAAH